MKRMKDIETTTSKGTISRRILPDNNLGVFPFVDSITLTLKELNVISEAVEKARTKLINQQSDTARKNQSINIFDRLILKVSQQSDGYRAEFVIPRKTPNQLDLKCTRIIRHLDMFDEVTLFKQDFIPFDITKYVESVEASIGFLKNSPSFVKDEENQKSIDFDIRIYAILKSSIKSLEHQLEENGEYTNPNAVHVMLDTIKQHKLDMTKLEIKHKDCTGEEIPGKEEKRDIISALKPNGINISMEDRPKVGEEESLDEIP